MFLRRFLGGISTCASASECKIPPGYGASGKCSTCNTDLCNEAANVSGMKFAAVAAILLIFAEACC